MMDKKFTFEDIPMVMNWLVDKLNELETKIDNLHQKVFPVQEKEWLSMDELREYLPSHPAEQTIYGWTSNRMIPYHKTGRRILFSRSEIDAWISNGGIRSEIELEEQATRFVKQKYKPKF